MPGIVGTAVIFLCTSILLYQRRDAVRSWLGRASEMVPGRALSSRFRSSHQHDQGAGRLSADDWRNAQRLLSDPAVSGSLSIADERALLDTIDKAAAAGSQEPGEERPLAALAGARLRFFGSEGRLLPDYAAALSLYTKIYEETGDPEAAHMLGLYHAEGIGIRPDPAKAFVLFTLAARADHFPALLTLGTWYSTGLHCQVDCPTARSLLFRAADQVQKELDQRQRKYRSLVPPESIIEPQKRSTVMDLFPSRDLIEYYQYSADRGQVESQTILGQVYYHGGADWDPDYSKALRYFQEAARRGGAVAMGYLGQMFLKGEGMARPDTHTAYLYFKTAAEGGSAMGLNGMGLCYWRGLEVVQDADEALLFFRKAAAKDHVEAMYNAAMLLKERDAALFADQIVDFLLKAVRSGHLQSHLELARMYGRQEGFCSLALYLLKAYVEKGDQSYLLDRAVVDYRTVGRTNQAISKYLFMAGQGYEVAQSNLAFILQSHDPNRAAVWWERSAGQGNYRSRVRIGDYFYYRHDNLAAAAANYLSAAGHKDPQGSFNLGWMYGEGLGVPKDSQLMDVFLEDSLKLDKRAALPILAYRLWHDWRDWSAENWDVLVVLCSLCMAVLLGFLGMFFVLRRFELDAPVRHNNRLRQLRDDIARPPPPRLEGEENQDGRPMQPPNNDE